VVVFTHHDPRQLQREAASRDIHKVERIEAWSLEPRFLERLGELTERNARWTLLRHEGVLTVTVGTQVVSGPVGRVPLAGA
jgi:uncharacterized protein YaeQ